MNQSNKSLRDGLKKIRLIDDLNLQIHSLLDSEIDQILALVTNHIKEKLMEHKQHYPTFPPPKITSMEGSPLILGVTSDMINEAVSVSDIEATLEEVSNEK